jgi:prolyl-tRNA editing enzyme YbaK/EbsC (Cys-tRNA(Pro) deacylase)
MTPPGRVGRVRKGKRLLSGFLGEIARDYPEFDLGAVPPTGGARRDPVVIDSRLVERESVVLEAGSHDQSVRLATVDLLRLTDPEVADICAD